MDEKVRVLEDVARNLFANVVWTHKIQEKQAEIYEHRFKWLSDKHNLCGINVCRNRFNNIC